MAQNGALVELWNSPRLAGGLVEKTWIAFKRGDTPVEFSVQHASRRRLVKEAAQALVVDQEVISSNLSVGERIFFFRKSSQKIKPTK